MTVMTPVSNARPRRPAVSTWGNLDETKRIVDEMLDAERTARAEKTSALRALRLEQEMQATRERAG